MTAEFQLRLDQEIMTGASSARIARRLEINCTTVRRRRSVLAASGVILPAPRIGREDSDATNSRA